MLPRIFHPYPRLAADLRLLVINEAIVIREGSLSSLACVNREWQNEVEARTWKTLKFSNREDILLFESLCDQDRLKAITHVQLDLLFPIAWAGLEAGRYSTADVLLQAFMGLFRVLKAANLSGRSEPFSFTVKLSSHVTLDVRGRINPQGYEPLNIEDDRLANYISQLPKLEAVEELRFCMTLRHPDNHLPTSTILSLLRRLPNASRVTLEGPIQAAKETAEWLKRLGSHQIRSFKLLCGSSYSGLPLSGPFLSMGCFYPWGHHLTHLELVGSVPAQDFLEQTVQVSKAKEAELWPHVQSLTIEPGWAHVANGHGPQADAHEASSEATLIAFGDALQVMPHLREALIVCAQLPHVVLKDLCPGRIMTINYVPISRCNHRKWGVKEAAIGRHALALECPRETMLHASYPRDAVGCLLGYTPTLLWRRTHGVFETRPKSWPKWRDWDDLQREEMESARRKAKGDGDGDNGVDCEDQKDCEEGVDEVESGVSKLALQDPEEELE